MGEHLHWDASPATCVSDTHIWNWNEHMSKLQQKNISLSKFLMWSMVNKTLLFGSKEVYQDVYYGLKWPWGKWDDSLPKKLTLPNMLHWKNAFAKCTYHFLSLTDGYVVAAGDTFLVFILKIDFPKRKLRCIEWLRKCHGTEVWSIDGKTIFSTLWSP